MSTPTKSLVPRWQRTKRYKTSEANFNYDSLNDHIEFSNHMARKKAERMKRWEKYDGKSEETAITRTWNYAPTDK